MSDLEMPGKKKNKVPIKSHTSDDDGNSTDSGSRQNGDLVSDKDVSDAKSKPKSPAEKHSSPLKRKRSADDDSPQPSPTKKV